MSGALRVVHLVTTVNIGGLETLVLDIVRHRGPDVEPHVICLDEPGTLAPRFVECGVPVESLGVSHWPFPLRVAKLARRLRQIRPQVLHTHNSGPHLHGAAAVALAGFPALIHTKHGRNYPDSGKRILISRVISAVTDWVVPVSDDAARVAIEIERVPAGKVLVFHNGVDLERFAYRPARQPGGAWHAVTVARLHPVKDQATMLRAMRIATDQDCSVRLDIIGDGPLRGELEALADQLGLREYVTFHGFHDDVERFLASADCFLLSSTTEGISLTLLEAMAVGLPVVATDVGGNREVVIDGTTGYLVAAQSPHALADAVMKVRSDPGRAAEMASAGRRRVEAEFDLRTTVAQYERLYRETIDRKRGRRRA